MQKNLNDNDILKFFQGFKYRPTKTEITQKYIEGRITKEEFLKQMKEAKK